MHRRRRSDGDRGRAFLNSATASADRAALIAALARVSQGDRQALHDVYRRTSAKLYGVILRIFPDPEDAQDVLQDAFITIWQRAGAFDPERASPITWLVTVTRNRAIDRYRAQARHRHASIDEVAEVADGRPNAESLALAADSEAQVLRCIDELKEGDGALIRTAFFQGVTYAELAERMATPLGTIKSRIRRALGQLRECLA